MMVVWWITGMTNTVSMSVYDVMLGSNCQLWREECPVLVLGLVTLSVSRVQ